ncbi:MAG: hemerythrin family protein [Pseudomonadota bacterium]
MQPRDENGMQDFIGWRPEYDSQVSIIDHQHRGILGFINNWYREIKGRKVEWDNLGYYLLTKFEYLEGYSKAHLTAEEKMLELMARDHGFSARELERHQGIHQRFIEEFMGHLADQVSTISTDQNLALLESLASEGLKDVARWWFSHIKTPTAKLPAGPDHIYREHLGQMAVEAKVALLNEMLLYFERSSVSNGSVPARVTGKA